MIQIRNESEVELMGVLSQLTPMHWCGPIGLGDTGKLECFKFWFTLSVNIFDQKRMPTQLGVAARLSAIASATLLGGLFAPAALALVGGVSGVTSSPSAAARKTLPWRVGDAFKLRGFKRDGVYADGRIIVVKGMSHADGTYQLYLDRIEWLDANGNVCKLSQMRTPKRRTDGAPKVECETCSCFYDGAVQYCEAQDQEKRSVSADDQCIVGTPGLFAKGPDQQLLSIV